MMGATTGRERERKRPRLHCSEQRGIGSLPPPCGRSQGYLSKVLPKKFSDKLDLTSDNKPLAAAIIGMRIINDAVFRIITLYRGYYDLSIQMNFRAHLASLPMPPEGKMS